MARIAREEHAAIRRRVDMDGERVADIAAAYGCTPANIYTILAKLRRQDGPATGGAAPAEATPEAAPSPAPLPAPAAAAPADLFEVPAELPAPAVPVPVARPPAAKPAETKAGKAGPQEAAAPPKAAVSPPKAQASKAPPRKPGYALLMRSSDGEEAVNPFRSLDELLSAAKPILRTAAHSPEPVWFSIQQVDLDTLDDLS